MCVCGVAEKLVMGALGKQPGQTTQDYLVGGDFHRFGQANCGQELWCGLQGQPPKQSRKKKRRNLITNW